MQRQANAYANDTKMEQMWKSTFIVGLTVIVLKLIGALQKIPLQNIAGDRVFGIYNAVYPIYQFMIGIIASGLPVAISLIIAEQSLQTNRYSMKRTVWVSTLLLTGISVLLFLFLWFNAPWIAYVIGDRGTQSAIKVVALSLLIVPIVAVFRGYYQGLGQILPSSFSQLVEQAVRVFAILLVLSLGWSMSMPEDRLAAWIMSGSIFGGVAALIVLVLKFRRENYKQQSTEQMKKNRIRPLIRRIVMTAIPVTLGALTLPMLSLVDSMTVARLLQHTGLSETQSMVQFGLYSRAQPLVQLIFMIAAAIGAVIAPVIATAKIKGEINKANHFVALILRGAWWLGCAASVGVLLLGPSINVAFFKNDQASLTFSLVGCTCLAGAVIAISSAILQGSGRLRLPVYIMLFAALLKAVLNYILIPMYGINGAAISAIVALTVAALLIARSASRLAQRGVSVPAARLIKLIAANRIEQGDYTAVEQLHTVIKPTVTPSLWRLVVTLLAMTATIVSIEFIVSLFDAFLSVRIEALLMACSGTIAGALVFLVVGLKLKAVSYDDILTLPNGDLVMNWLRKFKLMI